MKTGLLDFLVRKPFEGNAFGTVNTGASGGRLSMV